MGWTTGKYKYHAKTLLGESLRREGHGAFDFQVVVVVWQRNGLVPASESVAIRSPWAVMQRSRRTKIEWGETQSSVCGADWPTAN